MPANHQAPSKRASASAMRFSRLVLLLGVRSAGCLLQPPARTAVNDRSTRVAAGGKRVSKFALLVTPRNMRPVALPPPPQLPDKKAPAESRREELDAEYWYHPDIHNWGNIGPGGWFHAFWAPLATAIIDRTSYSGIDVRKEVHENPRYFPPGATVLDMCCGTGFSAVPSAGRAVAGIDTSPAMLRMARFFRPDATFLQGNAESFGADRSVDVVSVMFAMHEMPLVGRRRVLRNAMRLARRSVVVVDIDPDFEATLRKKPMQGASFLSGEPYVLEYLANMDDDVAECASRAPVRIAAPGTTWRMTRTRLLPKHVVVWHLERVY